jgi:hypothetical protein
MIYYTTLYLGTGGAIFAYLQLVPSAMGNVMVVVDAGADIVGFPWREYVDEGAMTSTFTHAVLAVACNEVLELVRLPFVLVTIPLIFRKRGGADSSSSSGGGA